MTQLPYPLERTVVIQARPEAVFLFLADSVRWASWWGAGSTIDATPGGKVYIRHPNGVETLGEVIEVDPPGRIAFTYGYASGNPIPPGGSRVTLRLESHPDGTRLHLRHEFAEAGPRDAHVQGWRFQLSLLGNAVANELFANAADAVDAWFGAWEIADDAARERELTRMVSSQICFRDRFSLLNGIADLTTHISAAQRFMPGIRVQRKGGIRQCHGTVLTDWVALDAAGNERMSGVNVFVLDADRKITSVTGFMNLPGDATGGAAQARN